MNPFHHTLDDEAEYHASLQDLIDMAPSLSDPKLDALCAAACDELYVEERDCVADGLYDAWWDSYLPFGVQWGICPEFTTDWREAGRLLVKYRIGVNPLRPVFEGTRDDLWEANAEEYDTYFGPDFDNPCRAITLAAVVAALTEMIEGGG